MAFMRMFAVMLLLSAGLLLLGCTGNGAATPPTGTPAQNSVDIRGSAFSPASLTIRIGDTVTWTNNDGTAHTVTSDSGSELSHSLAPGESWSHTFAQVGNYDYHCSIHTAMNGTVSVTARSP